MLETSKREMVAGGKSFNGERITGMVRPRSQHRNKEA